MKKKLIKLGIFSASVFLLFSCGTGSDTGDISTSSVSFYLTDKPKTNIEEVNITINKVEFKNTGRGNQCTLFEYDKNSQEPNPLENVNLLELADSYLFVNETECEKAPYNRLRVEFDRNITVKKDGQIYSCLVEGFDKGNGKQPNRPHCVGNSCYIEMNGAVNIAANVENVGVDFDIKNSKIVINETTGDCSVTFKLSPLHLDKEKLKMKKMKFQGFVNNLNTTEKTFELHHKLREILVNYSNIEQTEIEDILKFAEENKFDRRVSVKVKCSDFIKETKKCEAEEISLVLRYVKIQNLDEINKTFEIDFDNVTIDYSNADIDGELSNGKHIKAFIKSGMYSETDEKYSFYPEKIKVMDTEDSE